MNTQHCNLNSEPAISIIKFIVITVLTVGAFTTISSRVQADTFTMAFGEHPDQNPQYLFYQKIYSAAFNKLGYEFKYVVCPSKRCSILANEGQVDGEPQRIKSYGERFPNLIRVDEPVFLNRTLGFTRSDTIKVPNLENLKNYRFRIEYLRGSVWSKSNLEKFVTPGRLSAASSIEQAFKKLLIHRSDLFFCLEAPAMRVLQSADFRDAGIHPVSVLGENFSYPYLHKSHKNLVPLLSETLKVMKSSGEYSAILNEALPFLEH